MSSLRGHPVALILTTLTALSLTTLVANRAVADPPLCFQDGATEFCIQNGVTQTDLPAGAKVEGRSGHTKPLCTSLKSFPNIVVPCSGPEGVWIQSDECYAKALDPQPAKSDPAWKGHDDGELYQCAWQGAPFLPSRVIWFGTPPTPPLDPEELVLKGIQEMQLHAVTIGIVPKAGGTGLVGLPVWMWAADAGPRTVGPQERTLTVGAMTATMRAHVDRTDWTMGNGATVTCHGAGTPYEDRFGSSPSPTCGYTYTRPSAGYPVTATTHWVVDWTSSNDDAGQIRFALTATTTIAIAESQALT